MQIEELAEAIGQAQGETLDAVTRALWAGVAAGQIGDADADRLSAAIAARRPAGRAPGAPRAIILRPKPQRCPDRAAALERSRRWAAAGRMPPAIAAKFTQGEQAALAVIAFEISKRLFCDKAIGAIAALAGVSESTVKRAVRQARLLGFLTVEERRLSRFRNDTNIVRIVSKAWLSWLELRTARGGGQSCTGTNTDRIKKENKREIKALQGLPEERGRSRAGPPPGHGRPASRGRASS